MELKTSVGKSFLDLFTNTLAFGGTFASRTSPSTDQSLQKSFHLSHPDKIELKKISCPSKNKKYSTAQPTTDKHSDSFVLRNPRPSQTCKTFVKKNILINSKVQVINE